MWSGSWQINGHDGARSLGPTISVVDYDRTQPLFDGRVHVRGYAPVRQWKMPIGDMLCIML